MTVDFGEITAFNHYKLENGKFTIIHNGKEVIPKKAWLGLQHEREKKNDKIINNLPLDVRDLSFNLMNQVLNYDYIYAIDTNTKIINSISISCAGIVKCTLDKKKENATYGATGSFELWNAQHPEKASWQVLIEMITRGKNYDSKKRYALVVDSYLKDHSYYNNQTLPITPNYYLPPNFQLIYASSDKSDTLLNKLIQLADKAATNTLNHVQNKDLQSFSLGMQNFSSKPFTHFRVYKNSRINSMEFDQPAVI